MSSTGDLPPSTTSTTSSSSQPAAPAGAPGGTAGSTLVKFDLNEFAIGEVLGEGSYGNVVRAQHMPTGVEYAVKLVDMQSVMRLHAAPIILNEKAVLARVAEPSQLTFCIQLCGTLKTPMYLGFVMELCEGGELWTICRKTPISVDWAQHITFQLVEAVAGLHSRNIIHRDIKPENIVFKGRDIRLVDFGTALLDPEDLTEKPATVGTVEYLAPEVISDTLYTYKADTWAIGCTVYKMVTGQLAFHEGSEYLTMVAITKGDAPELDAPEEVREFVAACLTKDPDERPDVQALAGYAWLANYNSATAAEKLPEKFEPVGGGDGGDSGGGGSDGGVGGVEDVGEGPAEPAAPAAPAAPAGSV